MYTMVGACKNVQALVVIDTGAGTVPPAPTVVYISFFHNNNRHTC